MTTHSSFLGRVSRSQVAAAVLSAAFSPLAAAQAAFPGRQIPAGSSIRGVVTADLDLDGRDDFVTSNWLGPTISYIQNAGFGAFYSPKTAIVAIGPKELTAADMLNDGSPDLLVAHATTWISLISFNFSTLNPKYISVSSPSNAVVGADLDGNGVRDLIRASGSTPKVGVLMASSPGSYTSETLIDVGSVPVWISPGDVDGDGDLDMAVTCQGSGEVWMLGTQVGGSLVPLTVLALGGQPQKALIADASGDGILDVLSSHISSQDLKVSIGNGAGAFAAPQSTNVGSPPNWMDAADFDLDGRLDVAVASSSSGLARVLHGDGQGSFLLAQTLVGPSVISGLAIGKFAGDAHLDLCIPSGGQMAALFTANEHGAFPSSTIVPLAGAPRCISAGDFNRDGLPDLATLESAGSIEMALGAPGGVTASTVVSLGGAASDMSVADWNADGMLDLAVAASTGLEIFTGNGAGGFAAPVTNTAVASLISLDSADIDLDGDPDLVAADGNVVDAYVFTNQGGVFPSPPIAVGVGPSTGVGNLVQIEAVRMNADAFLDLVGSGCCSGSLSWVGVTLGTGPGTFGAKDTFGVNVLHASLLSARLDQDHTSDLIYGGNLSSPFNWRFEARLGERFGGYTPAIGHWLPADSGEFAAVDFDADGWTDVVASTADGLYCMRNMLWPSAGIVFGHALGVAGADAGAVAVADFDLDGYPDLIGGRDSGSLIISLNLHRTFDDAVSYGTGTPGCAGRLGLASGHPKIGSPKFAFSVSNAPPEQSVGLIVTDVQDLAGSDPFSVSLLFHVGLFSATEILSFSINTDASGAGTITTPIPNVPALIGASYFAQVLAMEPIAAGWACSAAAVPAVTSRGLAITIQN